MFYNQQYIIEKVFFVFNWVQSFIFQFYVVFLTVCSYK